MRTSMCLLLVLLLLTSCGNQNEASPSPQSNPSAPSASGNQQEVRTLDNGASGGGVQSGGGVDAAGTGQGFAGAAGDNNGPSGAGTTGGTYGGAGNAAGSGGGNNTGYNANGPGRYNNTASGGDADRTLHLERLAMRVPGVQGAHCVVVGNTAIVGIDVEGGLDRARVGTIKYSVSEALRKDPQGMNALVTADLDMSSRLADMRRHISQGRPVSGFAAELADMVGRIIPQLPEDTDTSAGQHP